MSEKFVQLETLAKGAIMEKFELEFAKVLGNIIDPNTKPTAARTITIKLKITPFDDRQGARYVASVSSSLAPHDDVGGTMLIGSSGGIVGAVERDGAETPIIQEINRREKIFDNQGVNE